MPAGPDGMGPVFLPRRRRQHCTSTSRHQRGTGERTQRRGDLTHRWGVRGKPMRVLRWIAMSLGAAVAGLLIVPIALQRRLLYHPRAAPEATALADAERLGLAPWRDVKGSLLGW